MRYLRENLIATAAMLALFALILGQAKAQTIDNLCGQTLTSDTAIQDVTETLTENCTITVADGVTLSFLDVDLDADGWSLWITGQGGAQLLMSNTEVVNSSQNTIAFVFADGNIDIQDSEFDALEVISSDDGDISVKWAKLTMSTDGLNQIKAVEGNVEFKYSIVDAESSGDSLEIFGTDRLQVIGSLFKLPVGFYSMGQREVEQNLFYEGVDVGYPFGAENSEGVGVKFMRNEVGESGAVTVETQGQPVRFAGNGGVDDLALTELSIFTQSGAIHVKNNDLNVTKELSVTSNAGNIRATRNVFGDPSMVTFNTLTGRCQANNNTPELVC